MMVRQTDAIPQDGVIDICHSSCSYSLLVRHVKIERAHHITVHASYCARYSTVSKMNRSAFKKPLYRKLPVSLSVPLPGTMTTHGVLLSHRQMGVTHSIMAIQLFGCL